MPDRGLVFVYGTLRPSLYPSVEERFDVKKMGDGTLCEGFKMYQLGRFPALIPTPGKRTIIGELVWANDIKILDAYEGYRPDGDGLYDRVRVAVDTDKGQMHAWVYVMKKLPSAGGYKYMIPSGDWQDELDFLAAVKNGRAIPREDV